MSIRVVVLRNDVVCIRVMITTELAQASCTDYSDDALRIMKGLLNVMMARFTKKIISVAPESKIQDNIEYTSEY